MITKSVSVSGSVGKQVFATGGADRTVLKGYSVYAPTSAATVVIREGNASGTVVHQSLVPIAVGSREFEFDDCGIRFDTGMHVKVTGVGSVAYLYLE